MTTLTDRSREQAPWTSDDQPEMNWIYSGCTPLGRGAATEFKDLDNGFLGPELARKLGISNTALPPVLSGITKRCVQVGRVPLWEYDPRTGRYFVDLVVRDLLREAL